MSRPSPRGARPTVTRGTSEYTVAALTAERKHRDDKCPWPCLLAGRITRLVDRNGCPRASWCRACDQALTQSDWDDLLAARQP
jgi:hypothetical protein